MPVIRMAFTTNRRIKMYKIRIKSSGSTEGYLSLGRALERYKMLKKAGLSVSFTSASNQANK